MNPPPAEIQALVLGTVQGLTEFLPISSSAHLVVIPAILGWPYLGKGFDVALHAGTLWALVKVLQPQLLVLWQALQRWIATTGRARDGDTQLLGYIALGSLPAAVAGFLLDPLLEPYGQGLLAVALLSIAWGGLLAWAESRPASSLPSALDARTAWLIGCAQAAALLPGTSRSGATITIALILGLSRPQAAQFSLLLSVPVVAGATLYKVLGGGLQGDLEWWLPALVGAVASAWVGQRCLRSFLETLVHRSLSPFAWYRIAFGTLTLGWFLHALHSR